MRLDALVQLLTSLDFGTKLDSQLRELTCDIRGKKSLPISENGLLSVDFKGGYNLNPVSRKVGELQRLNLVSSRIICLKFSNGL